MGVEALPWKSI